jgi:hypothetical protein
MAGDVMVGTRAVQPARDGYDEGRFKLGTDRTPRIRQVSVGRPE